MPALPLINLDSNATTAPRPEVLEEMVRVSREAPGNPGSRHALGRRARRELDAARERLARLLGARPDEVVFTSGGTEAINLAVRGLAGLVADARGLILCGPGEHPATVEAIAATGFPCRELQVDADGRLAAADYARMDPAGVRLATLLLAHNETGVVQDPAELIAWSRAGGIPVHLDAVQAVGKIDVDFRALGATALSLAAHKFHGPRGIGALLVARGAMLQPLVRGGRQEESRRPGTECVALAAGMARALELWHDERAQLTQRISSLRDELWQRLREACPEVQLIGHPLYRLPNTLNIAFPGCDGEALLVALDLAGVCCSLGTTCASGSLEAAPILAAMQVPVEWRRSCLRLSLGAATTPEEVCDAAARISRVVAGLRRGTAAGGRNA